MFIEVELFQVVITENSPRQVIVLKEVEGERKIPIIIHYNEAIAIDRKLKDFQVQRPMTHDLLKTVIESMGGRLERVLINDLQDGTFFARLIIDMDGRKVEIDSRPSDAIALAIRVEAPLFAEEQVIVQAGVPD